MRRGHSAGRHRPPAAPLASGAQITRSASGLPLMRRAPSATGSREPSRRASPATRDPVALAPTTLHSCTGVLSSGAVSRTRLTTRSPSPDFDCSWVNSADSRFLSQRQHSCNAHDFITPEKAVRRSGTDMSACDTSVQRLDVCKLAVRRNMRLMRSAPQVGLMLGKRNTHAPESDCQTPSPLSSEFASTVSGRSTNTLASSCLSRSSKSAVSTRGAPSDWAQQPIRNTGGASPAGRQMLDPLPDSLQETKQDSTSPIEVSTPLRQSRRRKKSNSAKSMKQTSDSSEEHNKTLLLLQRLMLGGDSTNQPYERTPTDKHQKDHQFGESGCSNTSEPDIKVALFGGYGDSQSSALPVNVGREIRYLDATEKIFDLFVWDEVLQESGDGGKVVICQPKALALTSCSVESDLERTYVLKMRSKESLQRCNLEEQFRKCQERLLNLQPHEGIVRTLDVFEDGRFYYTVMERACGGNLFDCLMRCYGDELMPISCVKMVLIKILKAVSHIHSEGILHRDIKPQNIVLSGDDITTRLSLIDFDHADFEWTPGGSPNWDRDIFGTIRFCAPEALLGYSSQAGDLYSAGVILYLLMTGCFPFNEDVFLAGCDHSHSHRKRIYERMQQATIDFGRDPWPDEEVCRDLCQRLLAFDLRDRLSSADQALSHDWFSK